MLLGLKNNQSEEKGVTSDCGEEEGVQGFIWPNNLTMEDNIYNDSHARTPAYEILPLPKEK